jgi:hypothetical protein
LRSAWSMMMKKRPQRLPIQPSNGVPSMVPVTRCAGIGFFR